MFELPTVLIEV